MRHPCLKWNVPIQGIAHDSTVYPLRLCLGRGRTNRLRYPYQAQLSNNPATVDARLAVDLISPNSAS
jgi:hypothetical protein